MRRYLNFSDEIQEYLDSEYKKIIGEEKEILGILCRGTDYVSLKPEGHPIQPNPVDVIKEAKKLFKKYNYKKIFLATEDINIYRLFKSEFGNMLIDNNQYRFNYEDENLKDKYLADIEVKRENHNYNLAKEYLLSLYILSKCKYLISGRAGGTIGVYLLSEFFKYQKYVHVWNLGNYKGHRSHYNNLFERIFSVKNEYVQDEKHKVITLMGIKLKLRNKNNFKKEFN